ncbi:MAG TPA: PAS domain S-box protein, partial [Verrucomicrobiae bacterium]|nr:PAS domain S-box protein [Verrucomicrobiae bacterium]
QIRERLDDAFTGRRVSYELSRPDPKGVYYYSVKYEPMEADGEVNSVVVVITDITERRLAEDAVRKQAALFDQTYDAVLVWLWDGPISFWNRGAERLYGFSRAEALGRTSHRLLQTQVPGGLAAMTATLGEKGQWEGELRQLTSDGRSIVVESRMTLVRDLGSSCVLEANRDVTERHRAEEAVRLSETRFRELADNINEVFWIMDPREPKMLYVSPAYERIWGRPSTGLLASPESWLEAVHPLDRQRVSDAAREKQTAGTYDEEYRIVRPNGEVRWIHDRAFPVRDGNGIVYRVVGTAEDITQRKKLEEQFQQAQKMESIGQLAGGVAHDFNNILAVIQMQSDLLMSSDDLSSEQAGFADEIRSTVQRASALTRQLLLFSRREVFQPRDMDLNESVTNIVKMLQRFLGEPIELRLKLASQPMFVHADPGMIDQIAMNLAVNARDAMPNGGHLVIETVGVEFDEFAASQSAQIRPGSFVQLSVSDSGCGIPAEILPKIFEPFFTTKETGKGTGLGLATVFGVVQQHQGWINVYSEVGYGTTFRIYIPRLSRNGKGRAVTADGRSVGGGTETILLVEDDPALRNSIRKALAQLGYRILEAPTGLKAIDVWNESKSEIRLLLTDLVMPDGMTGKDLAERLLGEEPKLRVIYMSGYSAEVVGKDFVLKEGTNFLTKPFPARKLAETVRKRLDS